MPKAAAGPLARLSCQTLGRMSLPDESPSAMFVRTLRMPKAIAEALVAGQVNSIEELAYIPVKELLAVPNVESWLLQELRDQARQYLLESL